MPFASPVSPDLNPHPFGKRPACPHCDALPSPTGVNLIGDGGVPHAGKNKERSGGGGEGSGH